MYDFPLNIWKICICLWAESVFGLLLILIFSNLVMQIENCNKPFLDALSQYDDGRDLSDYDFSEDGFGPLNDDINKRKLAYRHRIIAQKYKKVLVIWFLCISLMISFYSKLAFML